jgi:hypothetical protein
MQFVHGGARSHAGAVLLAGGLLAAACTSGGPTIEAQGSQLAWAPGSAEAADGTPPSYTAAGVCGSDTTTYLAELAQGGNPLSVKVLDEWGDIVPGSKQILVSGSLSQRHLGPTDNPITHPYGDDLSMDVGLDQPFLAFSKQLGPAAESNGQLHVEISSGLVPHVRRASGASPTQTWPALSAYNYDLAGFQPGFAEPRIGDRVLVMGRWIIDCGHPNYGTELHPMAFLAWTHSAGTTTVAHAYVNPYHDTESYTTAGSIAGHVGDQSRAGQAFPPFFVGQVLDALAGSIDHLSDNELIAATDASPAPWRVCAPPGSSGSSLQVHYDIVTRPGVDVSVTPEPHTACAMVTVTLTPSYTPMDASLRQCVLPWTYLQQIAKASFGANIDIKGLIDKFVTSPTARAIVDRDPAISCADALAGPTVSPSPAGQRIHVDDSQPIPFYGVVTVALS